MNQKLVFVLFFFLLIVSLLFASLVWLSLNPAEPTQGTYGVEVAFPNLTFNQPVGIYNAGDGTNRLFVVEQAGVIRVFENSGNAATSKVFLDISDRVLFGGEQGFLGLAFHPRYAENGYFYVNYVADNPRRTIVARYSVMVNDPDQAERNSELVLFEINQPFSNHKGGQLAFAADGYLYIGLGDGGSAGDPFGNAQNRSSLLGKILRVDVDSPSAGKNYGIPASNPFVGNTLGYREEIYAYGLRNPWRFSFDSVTGKLWVADVGQDRREEIDLVEKGKNYGWNIMEASLCYSPSTGCNQTGLELPIWEYGRDEGISVIGGFVYRGSALAGLYGAYVYGDYGSGKIWSLRHDGAGGSVNTLLEDTALNIVSFGLDENSELYFAAFDGKIHRLKLNQAEALPPTISAPSQVPLIPMPNEKVQISVSVTDASGIREVILSYRVDSVWINVSMTQIAQGTFSASIPALPYQTFVEYKIIAYDNFNNSAVSDNQGLSYDYTVIPEFSSVIIFVILLGATLLTAMVIKKRKNHFSPLALRKAM
jgi:glucose/arabinose dehydrogenase